MTAKRVALIAGVVLALLGPESAGAYDNLAHYRMGERAADSADMMRTVLIEDLGFPDGTGTFFRSGKESFTVTRWIATGAQNEDWWPWRVFNHFHDPHKNWFIAGLKDSVIGSSSVLWAQDPEQKQLLINWGGVWSWGVARQRFIDALTLPTRTERERAYADTFRALGQISHLLQDATVPAHVRNDAHLSLPLPFQSVPRIPINPDWYEDWTTRMAERDPGLLHDLIGEPYPPERSVFRRDLHPKAPAPIAGLFDVTPAGPGPVGGVFDDQNVGITEYTNRNFLSRSTMFKDYPLPSFADLGAGFLARAPDHPTALRQYFPKVTPGTTRVEIEHFAAEAVLYDALSNEPQQAPADVYWTLDERVHQDYAADLFPRAAGYSVALLDYFFRGRLDVDVVSDEIDPSRVRLEGTNASEEPLVSGTLTLFADDANGNRQEAFPVNGSAAIGGIDAGGPITTGAFQLPANAERVVAVYRGTLGDEASYPSRSLPGAAIGKVLGGYRVEHLVREGSVWKLRSPLGNFPLPITSPAVVELRWGDRDNTLVGRSAFGRFGEPNTFTAWVINRPEGSGDVPLVDGKVDVRQIAQATFPAGMSTDTTLSLTAVVDYRQLLIALRHDEEFVWNNDRGVYELVSSRFSPGPRSYSEPVVTGTPGLTASWPLTLALDAFNNFRARPYVWTLDQIALDTTGRILALVTFSPTQPPDAQRVALLPTKKIVIPCASFPCEATPEETDGPPTAAVFGFGSFRRGPISMLIDVQAATVVASTAGPEVAFSHRVRDTRFSESLGPANGFTFYQLHHVVRSGGGPADVSGFVSDAIKRFYNPCSSPDTNKPADVQVGETIQLLFGTTFTNAVQYNTELAALNLPPATELLRPVTNVCAGNDGAKTYGFKIQWDEPRTYFSEHAGTFGLGLRRTHGTPTRFALMFSEFQTVASQCEWHRVVTWEPEGPRAELRHDIRQCNSRRIESASRGAAVLASPQLLQYVPLEGSGTGQDFPGVEQADVQNYPALDPAFLYHNSDGRFYRTVPPLQPTALPALLAPGTVTGGDYHTIKLK